MMSLREADDVTEVLRSPRELSDYEWLQLRAWMRNGIHFIEDPNTTVARVAVQIGLVESINQARKTAIRVNNKVVPNPLQETVKWCDDWASIRTGKSMLGVKVIYTETEVWNILQEERNNE